MMICCASQTTPRDATKCAAIASRRVKLPSGAELSLHSAVVAKLPALFHRLQRKRKRQIFVSTHSGDLLSQKGIGGEEVVMLRPDKEGTIVELASSIDEVRDLLDTGLSIADVALPRTAPPIGQLELFE